MKRFACVLTVFAISGLAGAGSAQGALILNGDFSVNAASFTTFPGYLSSGGNPTSISNWNILGGNGGINGLDTLDATTLTPITVFGPTDQSTVRDYVFIQGFGGFSQDISLTPGQEYRVDFSAAARAGEISNLARVQIIDTAGIIPYGGSGDFVPSSTAFVADSFTFTAPATFTGSLMLQLYNLEAGSDTVVFSNVALYAIPEPSSAIMLLGSGLMGLVCWVSRMRK